jgi:hypothetical protein
MASDRIRLRFVRSKQRNREKIYFKGGQDLRTGHWGILNPRRCQIRKSTYIIGVELASNQRLHSFLHFSHGGLHVSAAQLGPNTGPLPTGEHEDESPRRMLQVSAVEIESKTVEGLRGLCAPGSVSARLGRIVCVVRLGCLSLFFEAWRASGQGTRATSGMVGFESYASLRDRPAPHLGLAPQALLCRRVRGWETGTAGAQDRDCSSVCICSKHAVGIPRSPKDFIDQRALPACNCVPHVVSESANRGLTLAFFWG